MLGMGVKRHYPYLIKKLEFWKLSYIAVLCEIKRESVIYLCIFGHAGLRCCARAFSSCGEWGLLFAAACGPLLVLASLVEHGRGLQFAALSQVQ